MSSENKYQLLSYTRQPAGLYEEKLAYSMHLAVCVNEGGFIPLNHNTGVLYVKAAEQENRTLKAKCLANPYIFKLGGEGYGVVAVRVEADGQADESSKGQVMLFTTKDFLEYTEWAPLDLKTGGYVRHVACTYLPVEERYCLQWCDVANRRYQAYVTELGTEEISPEPAASFTSEVVASGIEGARPVNVLEIPARVAEKLLERLTVPYNTGVGLPDAITVSSREELDAVQAAFHYSDGTTVTKPVTWEADGIRWDAAGQYMIAGEVNQPSFFFPVSINRADPCIFKWQGYYYFIATNDADNNSSISVRRGETIQQLATAAEYEILNTKMYPHMVQFLWAPEFHQVDGELYIFLASSPEGFGQIRSHVMKLKPGGDIRSKGDWEKPEPVLKSSGEVLSDIGLTLDMTTVCIRERYYAVWAQRDLKPVDLGSWIYIAEINKKEPWKLISEPMLLSKPDYSWANNHTFVDEGPYPLFAGDTLYITFSSALVDYTYCVGYLSIHKDADLLDAANWTKGNYPLLTAFSVPGECGPGHNAYVEDDSGMVWNTYHARPGKDGPRSTGIRRVHFHKDGFPVLDMTEDKDIDRSFRKLNLTVKVKP